MTARCRTDARSIASTLPLWVVDSPVGVSLGSCGSTRRGCACWWSRSGGIPYPKPRSMAGRVVEKGRHPVPEAALKVGESSVEIGAHYFQKRLALEPHLRSAQLEKLGLRYFFPQGDNRDLTTRVELGPPHFAPVPSFQLDRGR